MKIVTTYGLSIFLLILFSCGPQANKNEIAGARELVDGSAIITFVSSVNDMGMINEGEQVLSWFEYENTGTAPLIITKIQAGCGCTVPKWNDSPLAPGNKETIKIIFDSRGKKGTQNIKISVHSNAQNFEEELRIKAIVRSIN